MTPMKWTQREVDMARQAIIRKVDQDAVLYTGTLNRNLASMEQINSWAQLGSTSSSKVR